MLNNASILITGGTGSFGNTFVPMTLAKYNPKRLVIYSRDEMKQWEMAQRFNGDPRVSFIIGDVRDKDRLTRYGNVMGSRGSVIPFFLSLADTGVLPITDPKMTRFMITLEQGVELVWHAFNDMQGGEIYVKKIPSMTILDLANATAPKAKHKVIGIRPGEKIHEQMIGIEDAPHTYAYEGHFKILPMIHNWSADPVRIKNGVKVSENFIYTSDNNTEWMPVAELQEWIEVNQSKIGAI